MTTTTTYEVKFNGRGEGCQTYQTFGEALAAAERAAEQAAKLTRKDHQPREVCFILRRCITSPFAQ